MSDETHALQDALRAASDGLLLAIREVDARERLKRGVLPGDPRFEDLARNVTIAAEAVLRLARAEQAAAKETSGEPAASGMPTIDASPPPTDLASILAEWRAVEQRLAAAPTGSPEAERLMEEFEALRDRYAKGFEAHRPKH